MYEKTIYMSNRMNFFLLMQGQCKPNAIEFTRNC
jgi:hypothetical protein